MTQTERTTKNLIDAFTKFERSAGEPDPSLFDAFDSWVKDPKFIEAAEDKYDREKSEALREIVIQLRDNALTAGKFEWAVSLSHLIAWMAVVMDERWPKK